MIKGAHEVLDIIAQQSTLDASHRYFDGLLLRNLLTGWCLDPMLAQDYAFPRSLVVAPCLTNGNNAGDSPMQQMWLWGQMPGTTVSELRGDR